MEPGDVELDQELDQAPRTLSPDLFHYTNADAALYGILASGKLRLSPFSSTNDLWESRPSYYSLSSHADDSDFEDALGLWNEFDRNVRLGAKVASLTQDWILPDYVIDENALRGWSHLSLWAHYGAAHGGVCLRFDRESLVEALRAGEGPGVRVFHGPVEYRAASFLPPFGIDVGQVREFGVDAVAAAFVAAHAKGIFFEKHRDWAPESEYRLVRLDQSVLPFELDIRHALKGVILGEQFPESRIPALQEALEDFEGVRVHRMHFHSRRIVCLPLESAGSHDAGDVAAVARLAPRRAGSRAQRTAMLEAAEAEARALYARAERLVAELRVQLGGAMTAIANKLESSIPGAVRVFPTTSAVPASQQARKPGTPGEQVHYQTGLTIFATSPANSSVTLACSAALQVLDAGVVRLHASAQLEDMRRAPDQVVEHWAATSEGSRDDASERMNELLDSLLNQGSAVVPALLEGSSRPD